MSLTESVLNYLTLFIYLLVTRHLMFVFTAHLSLCHSSVMKTRVQFFRLTVGAVRGRVVLLMEGDGGKSLSQLEGKKRTFMVQWWVDALLSLSSLMSHGRVHEENCVKSCCGRDKMGLKRCWSAKIL